MCRASLTWEQTCYLGAMSPQTSGRSTHKRFRKYGEIFGRPEINLFASEDNTHCQTYFSKDRDVLAHDWPNLLLYAFPPISLIMQVIRQIREQKHRVQLVAPLWRNQHTSSLSCLGCSLQPRGPFPWDDTSSLRRTEQFGTPSLNYGRYIFSLSMGAFEQFKYCFSG